MFMKTPCDESLVMSATGSAPCAEATERENGKARAGRNFAEIFDDLLPHERLILRLRVEKVEQKNVDGIGASSGRKIGEDVGRHRRQLHFVGSSTLVFLERSENLRAAVLGYLEVILADAGNGLSLYVCDNHVHHDDATFDFDCRALNRRGNRRPLLAGLRETDPWEKEERGGREKGANHANAPESFSQQVLESTQNQKG